MTFAYPINRSLNLRMKSSCSDFARSRLSSCLQVLICQSGLSCSGYRCSNVFILVSYCRSGCGSQVRHHFIHSTHYFLNSSHSYIIFYIHLYYPYTTVFCLQTSLDIVEVTGEVVDRTGEVHDQAGHSSEVQQHKGKGLTADRKDQGKGKRIRLKPKMNGGLGKTKSVSVEICKLDISRQPYTYIYAIKNFHITCSF